MKALAAGVNAAEIDWPGVGTSLLDYSYPEGWSYGLCIPC